MKETEIDDSRESRISIGRSENQKNLKNGQFFCNPIFRMNRISFS